ncbi:hypothetical protein HHK36_006081 [Tetracentron sinense]|uniref:RanBP2-type domain-containing protein n=1 Tax=Tetracentron sinense TaxID=13715 RepID=A0A834ZK71_TETSI|nr:hypothetical protein HHK36_006081 [Tetracentron sinense]
MSRLGDWNCRSCQHLNFQRRDSCQLCGYPRLGGSAVGRGLIGRAGDWYCSAANCGTHNFAVRSNCFRCSALRDDSNGGNEFSRPGWLSGDWICTRCNEHNFASRKECHRCNAPRDYGNKYSFST